MAKKSQVEQREVEKPDDAWSAELTPEQYQVLRKAGTEPAFSGRYWDCHDDGMYRCAGCGAELFDASTKFESGTGWPSFSEPVVAEAVEVHRDLSHGMLRTEVVCRRCGIRTERVEFADAKARVTPSSAAADRRRLSVDADQSRGRASRRELGQSPPRRKSLSRRVGSHTGKTTAPSHWAR